MDTNDNLPMSGPRQHTPALFSSDPAAIAAAEQARAQIQTAFQVAMMRPRDPMGARDRIIDACKRPRFAEAAEYAKPVGGRKITGPSIRFAEEAIRSWGNILTQTQVVYEDEDILRIRVTCIDLETNAQYSKEMQIRKVVERSSGKDREVVGERTNTYGKMVFIVKATDDELHNKVASSISKCVRNEGLRLIPSDVVDEAMEVARKTRAGGDARDPQARLKAMCDMFSDIGIKPSHLASYLGHPLTDPISVEELDELRTTYRAIRDGDTTWSAVMETREQSPKVAATGAGATNALKERLGINDNAAAAGNADLGEVSEGSAQAEPPAAAASNSAGNPGVSPQSPQPGNPAESNGHAGASAKPDSRPPVEAPVMPNFSSMDLKAILPESIRLLSGCSEDEFAEYETACKDRDLHALVKICTRRWKALHGGGGRS